MKGETSDPVRGPLLNPPNSCTMAAVNPPDDSDRGVLLGRLPYFAKLSPAELGALAQQLVRHAFDAGAIICLEGEPSAGMWIIAEGRVKVYRLSPDGHEHILRLFGPGDSFNDVAALDGGPNPATVAALSPAALWLLRREALAAALSANHTLALDVIAALTGTVRTLVQQIEELALYSAMARLARFLLAQTENPALSGPGVTRAAIAAHLATTPETVSRALRTLEEVGAIRFDRHRIVIVKAGLLREMAML